MIDRVVCGDSAILLKELPDNCIDLTVTSPPYEDLRDYDNYSGFDFETIASQLYRVTKEGGVLVWVVGDKTKDGNESLNSFKQALHFQKVGFRMHDTMIYHKYAPPLTHNRYEQHFEYMFVFAKCSPKTFNAIMEHKKTKDQRMKKSIRRNANATIDWGSASPSIDKIMGNVWSYSTGKVPDVSKDDIAYQHPAIFPELLARDHIESWSNIGDTVLDPFAGSGTTLKMAHLLQRHYIGFEISAKYVEIIRKRMNKYRDQRMEAFLDK